ncbi:2'-hydroxybiphenyl-2-sulfinate desulfinase [Hamadaea flava]|uniref:ABC transporter substrate-binding protein n=1 Tax=Hamadaea flava TaxID=1742688 RepID=A0ABV8LPS8_9ACTN|nr:ABC transporter substrate-binding protein [Hamadaea flava]MCP2323066.1 2'-hydroxybiphenyl-2-sulfinate desulfinase [Hamadaea flava]
MTAVLESTVDKVWYTRCPVPTASGLALNLGWLAEEFGTAGLDVGVLQDAGPELARHHYDHQLLGLFREGGNVPALAAKSEGAATRLIGLTWIDEWQSVLVRADSPITGPAGLAGATVALPGWGATRGQSFPRAMALHGFKGALSLAGLTLDDVRPVTVPSLSTEIGRDRTGGGLWPGLQAVADGAIDAVYVKGAKQAEDAARLGLRVAVDLDEHPDRRYRVNNGTPRPITVHERLLAERPELVVRFLVQTLRAADWAAGHLDELRTILARETRSGADGVLTAYRSGFHRTLHPTLDADRLDLLDRQQRFLALHGFLAGEVDVYAWAAPEVLEAAHREVAA